MKFVIKTLLSFVVFFAVNAAIAAGPDLAVGALYVVKANDNAYHVAKVVALEPGTVHTRRYSNTFPAVPKHIESKDLKTSAEHAAIETDTFLAEKPVKVGQEQVREEELESYWIYVNSKSEIYVDPKSANK